MQVVDEEDSLAKCQADLQLFYKYFLVLLGFSQLSYFLFSCFFNLALSATCTLGNLTRSLTATLKLSGNVW